MTNAERQLLIEAAYVLRDLGVVFLHHTGTGIDDALKKLQETDEDSPQSADPVTPAIATG